MTVTDQQARAITFLAQSARPHGATRWDEAGIFKAVMRIADWSLHEAIHEVIAAAADHTAETPGVIGKAGNHRKATEKAPEVPRVSYDPRTTCHDCGQPKHDNSDHPFRSVEYVRSIQSCPIPAALKDAIVPTRTFAKSATEEKS